MTKVSRKIIPRIQIRQDVRELAGRFDLNLHVLNHRERRQSKPKKANFLVINKNPRRVNLDDGPKAIVFRKSEVLPRRNNGLPRRDPVRSLCA